MRSVSVAILPQFLPTQTSQMVASWGDDDMATLGDGAQRDQLQRSKASMPVLADDDVIVHQYSERRRYRRSHGSSAYPPARARIAGRVIVLIQVVIAALRESPVGPSRHIAPPRKSTGRRLVQRTTLMTRNGDHRRLDRQAFGRYFVLAEIWIIATRP